MVIAQTVIARRARIKSEFFNAGVRARSIRA